MNILHKDQRGFSATEGILALVVVVVVGFVGWYVWHAKQASDKVLNLSSAQSAAKTPGVSQTTAGGNTPGSKDNQALQTDLSSVTSSSAQSGQDLTSSTNDLNDQSTFTAVPQ